MAKVYAFNPPTGGIPDSKTGNRGLGVYYSKLGMRRMDVDKRTRMHGSTGRDYKNVVDSFEDDREKSKPVKEAKASPRKGIPMGSTRDLDREFG